jgi:hypothetical protein
MLRRHIRSSAAPSPTPWSWLAQRLTLYGALWLLVQSTLVWADAHTEPWRWWALGMTVIPISLFLLGGLLAWLGGRWLRRIGWGLVLCLSLALGHQALRAARDLSSTWSHGR